MNNCRAIFSAILLHQNKKDKNKIIKHSIQLILLAGRTEFYEKRSRKYETSWNELYGRRDIMNDNLFLTTSLLCNEKQKGDY